MKLKQIERTAIQSWSPASHHPLYLATGTSAQQLDATFSTNAALEIFELDFSEPSLDTKLRGSLPATSRFHKLIWSNHDVGSDGVIAAGGDTGTVTLYNAEQILASGSDPIVGQSEKHTGPVRALDFNPFQNNLMASGASDSEIYIWDLNNFSTPMTPGAKSQPSEDISCVAWNRQVQHILASAHPSGRAVVWDLRKNEPIIKVSDHSNRMRCSGMAWNPEVATQLVLASEDDRMPVLQIWDLRFATSPLKMLESHHRGILSISWCQADAELLLSSAKDNRILCWNPNTGEVVYELPTSNQWCFDVQWCPRNPAVLSAASFDGRISVYSVMGGSLAAQKQSHIEKISSSFNNLDPFGTGQSLPPLDVPHKAGQASVVLPLKKPPKWIRRPIGASFSFGGKLITFSSPKPGPPQTQQPAPRQVFVSVVTTETEFLHRSSELQTALQSGAFVSYCQSKINAAPTEFEQSIWNFLKVNFEQDPRTKYLKLLGYNKEELGLRNNMCGFFPPDTDGLISQALLVGNFEGAVELCLKDERFADAIILAIAGGEDLLAQTQRRYFAKKKTKLSRLVSSVVTHNWRDIVQSCDLDNWKEALAALLTYAKPEEFPLLCDTLGFRLELESEKLCVQACLCYICSGNVEKLVECWVKTHESATPLALEDLVEKVMVLKRAIEILQGSEVSAEGPVFAKKLTQYASLLASQGSLEAAMSYLPTASNQLTILQLRDRLFHAQGEDQTGHQAPAFPFNRVATGKVRSASTPAPASTRQTPPQRGPQQPIQQVCEHWGDGGFHVPRPARPTISCRAFSFSAPLPGTPSWNPSNLSSSLSPQMERYIKCEDYYYFISFCAGSVWCLGVSARTGGTLCQGRCFAWTLELSFCFTCCSLKMPILPTHWLFTCFPCLSFQPLQQLPTEKIVKKQIPEEHMVLKMTLDRLVQRCLLSASDPQTKRKLDDAAKRLENLYDKLRDQSLSVHILSGLHEIVRNIEVKRYQNALAVHTQIVSSSNFSEISAFMPVLKVVVTIASKLNV
uniref:Protein transport protein Sec31A n=1 Tax=Callorhinchus milii TaxID=7868 RepID=A0A4W3HWT1_CALMI